MDEGKTITFNRLWTNEEQVSLIRSEFDLNLIANSVVSISTISYCLQEDRSLNFDFMCSLEVSLNAYLFSTIFFSISVNAESCSYTCN